MLQADVKAAEAAHTHYKEIIKRAISEKDETTRLLFESILSEEERHHDTFTTLLGR
jgi:bacterioferritin